MKLSKSISSLSVKEYNVLESLSNRGILIEVPEDKLETFLKLSNIEFHSLSTFSKDCVLILRFKLSLILNFSKGELFNLYLKDCYLIFSMLHKELVKDSSLILTYDQFENYEIYKNTLGLDLIDYIVSLDYPED